MGSLDILPIGRDAFGTKMPDIAGFRKTDPGIDPAKDPAPCGLWPVGGSGGISLRRTPPVGAREPAIGPRAFPRQSMKKTVDIRSGLFYKSLRFRESGVSGENAHHPDPQ